MRHSAVSNLLTLDKTYIMFFVFLSAFIINFIKSFSTSQERFRKSHYTIICGVQIAYFPKCSNKRCHETKEVITSVENPVTLTIFAWTEMH